MPIDVYRNSNIYNMQAEGEIAELLSRFNSNYIMNVINDCIKNRFAFNQAVSNPNIVRAFETNFKGMLANFPNDRENVLSIREEVYTTIINKICSSFNLQYIGDNPDTYILAYNMYDVFVSGFSRNVVNFFATYIYRYKSEIYNNMCLDRYRKSKDSTTNYMRKAFDDIKEIDIIVSRIKEVIYYISGFDIDLYGFLSIIYPKDICDYIYTNVQPLGNIFKDEICQVINVPSILTEIRIAIQNLILQDQGTVRDFLTSNENNNPPDNESEEENINADYGTTKEE